ncbi:YSC84-related protein [Paracoccus sp. WLY502]|uniref:lipid-binding SYLF domain-containing protein n=1 Tax=Paracoccus yibinensis TaxID=3068891 RepID=UPI0027968298|nr:YSC84-related protein [Paracoccus sp. WLY502]MDQ1899718.1 YSC84-related protein [Paracoccus sp. WLY502]
MSDDFKLGRRAVLKGAAGTAVLAIAGCSNAVGTNASAELDARVDATHQYLIQNYPSAQALVQNARGVLYMPLMTEAALGVGGAYGQGALRIGGATVDYYSATRATVGLQAGAQQYAHVLIFQTDAALASFRASPGWLAGANAFYAIPQGGMALGADTITAQLPVVAMIFGQAGLMAGASIEGTKYTRIIPSEIPTLGFGGLGLPQMPQMQMPQMGGY